jgi:hypothetical protein
LLLQRNGGIRRLQTSRESNLHSSVYLAVTRVTDGSSGQAAVAMQGKMNLKQSRKHTHQDFAVTMMLAAVVGAISQVAQIVVEIGRSAGWWH